MKAITLTFFSLFFYLASHSQVSGHLYAHDKKPLAFATVSLRSGADSALISSVRSDDSGFFNLHIPASGKYTLRVTCIGFKPWQSALLQVSGVYDAGNITLEATGNQLAEVAIRATKPAVEQRNGGLVVNVQQSLLARGSSILEVLGRSPGVTIDPSGNGLKLNGKADVMVMMDGKLLRLPLAQVMALLKGMPAADINQIELLNTPPAKYDADGNGGLINIVTKKNRTPGTSGSVTAAVGYSKGGKASADLNLAHQGKKLSTNINYSYAQDNYYSVLLAGGTENVSIIGGPTNFNYHSVSRPVAFYQGGGAGLDYRADSATTIGASVYYAASTNITNSHNYGNYLLPDSNLVFDSYLSGRSHSQYVHPSLYLAQKLGKTQKLNIALDYFGRFSNSPLQVNSNFKDSLFSANQQNQSKAGIRVGVAQADFSSQLDKKLQLEAGVKATYTRTQSISTIAENSDGTVIPNTALSNNLLATESIGAGYASFNWQPDSLSSLTAGARFEYSSNSLNLDQAANRKLGRLFPNLSFSRKLSSVNSLQASYSERISRPSYSDLASFVNYNDPVSVFTGNPALKPTITRNLKFGLQHSDYIFSMLFSRDELPILGTQIMTGPVRGLVYLKPENADWQNNIVLQTTIPIKISERFLMSYTLSGGYHKYHISFLPQTLEKAYLDYSINFSESLKLPAQWSLELSGNYNSQGFHSNSRYAGNAQVNLGIKKESHGNTFQLAITDVFMGASYRSSVGVLIRDAFDTNVRVDYRGETHSRPYFRLSYFRSFGRNGTKARDKAADTKAEEKRL